VSAVVATREQLLAFVIRVAYEPVGLPTATPRDVLDQLTREARELLLLNPVTLPPYADRLAGVFIACMKNTLSLPALVEVDERNRVEADRSVCHSHDFCDANMVMYSACQIVFPGCASPEDVDAVAWNAAWNEAKKRGFSK
jgi:hypothetical protein